MRTPPPGTYATPQAKAELWQTEYYELHAAYNKSKDMYERAVYLLDASYAVEQFARAIGDALFAMKK